MENQYNSMGIDSQLPPAVSENTMIGEPLKMESRWVLPKILTGVAAVLLVGGVATASYFVSSRLATGSGLTPNAPESQAEASVRVDPSGKSLIGVETSAGGATGTRTGGTTTTTTNTALGGVRTSAGGATGSTTISSSGVVPQRVVGGGSGGACGASGTYMPVDFKDKAYGDAFKTGDCIRSGSRTVVGSGRSCNGYDALTCPNWDPSSLKGCSSGYYPCGAGGADCCKIGG